MMKRSQGILETATAATESGKLMSMDKARHFLGHTHHPATINTTKHLGWGKPNDNNEVCQPCAEVKAKQKLVPQATIAPRLTIPNKRLYHDMAMVKTPAEVAEKVSKPNWQLIVDEALGIKLLLFHKNTGDVLDSMITPLKAMERFAGQEIKVWC